jgi:hypothetical protein
LQCKFLEVISVFRAMMIWKPGSLEDYLQICICRRNFVDKHKTQGYTIFYIPIYSPIKGWQKKCHPVSQLLFLQITPFFICTSHYVFISYIVSSTWRFLETKEILKVLLMCRYMQYYSVKVNRRDTWDIVCLCNSLLYKASSVRYLVNKENYVSCDLRVISILLPT